MTAIAKSINEVEWVNPVYYANPSKVSSIVCKMRRAILGARLKFNLLNKISLSCNLTNYQVCLLI